MHTVETLPDRIFATDSAMRAELIELGRAEQDLAVASFRANAPPELQRIMEVSRKRS